MLDHILSPFQRDVEDFINLQIQTLWGLEADLSNLTIPPDSSYGQLSFPCFSLSKILKKPPVEIAQTLASHWKSTPNTTLAKVDTVGPYLNFFLNPSSTLNDLYLSIISEDFFNLPLTKTPQTLDLEYSQPNTHKALHVGHLRCLYLGDSLGRILRRVGHRVISTTYVGDTGTHILKILWFIKNIDPSILTTYKTIEKSRRSEWLGNLYTLSAQAYSDQKPPLKEIALEWKKEGSELHSFWEETRKWSLEEMHLLYDWSDVSFHRWFYESELETSCIDLVRKNLELGLFCRDDGAIGIDLSPYDLGFSIVLTSDDRPLYLTKDLQLIQEKFDTSSLKDELKNQNIDTSIVVVDSRQTLHFKQVFKISQIIGFNPDFVHIAYETVNNSEGHPFSSRELSGTTIHQLIQSINEALWTHYLQHRNPENLDIVQKTLAHGALRYGMLKYDTQTPVQFSLSDWIKLEGQTGPYLQYVCARCHSLLDKFQDVFSTSQDDKDEISSLYQTVINENNYVFSSGETQLLFLISQLNQIILKAGTLLKPHIIAQYLFQVAKLFNQFYELSPIQGSTDLEKKIRLGITYITHKSLIHGMSLLGMGHLKKM